MPFEASGNFGDMELRAEAPGLERLFENMAAGLYRLSAGPAAIKPEVVRDVALTSENTRTLLVNFLNELIFLLDTRGFAAGISKVRINEKKAGLELTAELKGEEDVFRRHPRGLLVKAATYHNLSVESKAGQWRARVTLDI